MTQQANTPQGKTQTNSALGRQVIVSVIALGIIGLGAWSMWHQSAPYHPEFGAENVTQGAVTALSDTSGSH